MSDPRMPPSPRVPPTREPIYRAILAVLVASVLVGAVLALAGEALFGSRALANVGFGMAMVCGLLYWVFRLIGRRAQQRHDDGRQR
jgi:high-affinity Fe2+/Pb2+ permease